MREEGRARSEAERLRDGGELAPAIRDREIRCICNARRSLVATSETVDLDKLLYD